jgi:hypothetical protein
MDNLPIVPQSLFDVVRQQSELARKQCRAQELKQRRKDARHPALTGDGGYRSLVLKDRLFFRIAPVSDVFPVGAEEFALQAAKVEEAFKVAFLSVWAKIPETDRHCLVSYWREPLPPGPSDFSLGPRTRPVIEITLDGLSDDETTVCSKFGHTLTFSWSLVADHPERLQLVIARTLAKVHRQATGQHWRLVVDMVEDPLAAWEARQKKEVTDAARNRKLDVLEPPYLRAYEAEITQLVRSWGLLDCQARQPKRAGRGKRKE